MRSQIEALLTELEKEIYIAEDIISEIGLHKFTNKALVEEAIDHLNDAVEVIPDIIGVISGDK